MNYTTFIFVKHAILLPKEPLFLNKEKITIQDIADSLGLSRNTVSKALNNHPSLPGDTHSKVIQRATEMNYKHARIDLNESFCILEDDRYFADYKWLKERLASMKNFRLRSCVPTISLLFMSFVF